METRNEGTAMHSHNQLRCWISKVQAMPRNQYGEIGGRRIVSQLDYLLFRLNASLESCLKMIIVICFVSLNHREE